MGYDRAMANPSAERGFGLIVLGIYSIACWHLYGATLGKWLMGLRLVRMDGGRPSIWADLLRYVVMIVLAPLWITWWPALIRKDHRGIHDLAAGTCLILARSEGLGWHPRSLLNLGRSVESRPVT